MTAPNKPTPINVFNEHGGNPGVLGRCACVYLSAPHVHRYLEINNNAGFRCSSQGQVNSAVAAKEHSRVYLCLRLALRKPGSQPTRLSALVQTREDGMPQSTS
ncbi:unnamed protein product [Nezara viridula]|uniref:Uncharacterized protein n=1 Tax=Nezara viridula TaxID=85310 RepID=A0A9P0H4Y7_NEZVI|nr:unnamed protein product [Nezara viridula]